MHTWHEKNNAVFVDAGVWLRPRYYKRGDENLFEGSKREAKNVRTNVGVCDVSAIDPVVLLRFKQVLVTVAALKLIEERLS